MTKDKNKFSLEVHVERAKRWWWPKRELVSLHREGGWPMGWVSVDQDQTFFLEAGEHRVIVRYKLLLSDWAPVSGEPGDSVRLVVGRRPWSWTLVVSPLNALSLESVA